MYSSRGRRRSVACCEGHGQAYLLPRPGCHMNMRHDMRGQDQPYRYSARRQESNMHGLNPNFISLLYRCSHGALGAGWAWPWGRPALRALFVFRVGTTDLGSRSAWPHSASQTHVWGLAGRSRTPNLQTGFYFFTHTSLSLVSLVTLGSCGVYYCALRANKKNKIHTRIYLACS